MQPIRRLSDAKLPEGQGSWFVIRSSRPRGSRIRSFVKARECSRRFRFARSGHFKPQRGAPGSDRGIYTQELMVNSYASRNFTSFLRLPWHWAISLRHINAESANLCYTDHHFHRTMSNMNRFPLLLVLIAATVSGYASYALSSHRAHRKA